MSEIKYDSDYEVRLATLKKLGGDVDKHYDSVYDVDLAILEKTGGEGGSWGSITGDITEQTDLVNYVNEEVSKIVIPESNKEVISILSYNGEPASASEGDYYINESENKLYKYISGEWVEQTPSVDCLYVAIDSSRIYAYINNVFTEVTGQDIDGVIAVNEDDLDSTLAQYKEDGVYTVISMYVGENVSKTLYSLSVTKDYSSYNDRYTTTQILRNEEYIYTRTYNWSSETWSAWRTKTYAFLGINNTSNYLARFDNEGKLTSAGKRVDDLQNKLYTYPTSGIKIENDSEIHVSDVIVSSDSDENTIVVDGSSHVQSYYNEEVITGSGQSITINFTRGSSNYNYRDVYVLIPAQEFQYTLMLGNGATPMDGITQNTTIGADKWVVVHAINVPKFKTYHNMPAPEMWIVDLVRSTQGYSPI